LAKIELDKYYTSPELAKYCVEITKEIIGNDNITEYIEPSAGSGVFLDYLEKPYLAYDIEPEDERVEKHDYLSLELDYKKGRCVIGNPPFGTKNNLTVAFYKKSVEIAEYIAFILPISQYNNDIKLYEYDLLHSEDLGKRQYSDRVVHCCFNIYRKPICGINQRPNYHLKDVEIKESIINQNPKRQKIVNISDFNYDIRICGWGAIGKPVEYPNQYVKEFCIKINNIKLKDKISELILNTRWSEIYPMTATPNLLQWQVYKFLKEKIPELQ
jgi:hypothetical protein